MHDPIFQRLFSLSPTGSHLLHFSLFFAGNLVTMVALLGQYTSGGCASRRPTRYRDPPQLQCTISHCRGIQLQRLTAYGICPPIPLLNADCIMNVSESVCLNHSPSPPVGVSSRPDFGLTAPSPGRWPLINDGCALAFALAFRSVHFCSIVGDVCVWGGGGWQGRTPRSSAGRRRGTTRAHPKRSTEPIRVVMFIHGTGHTTCGCSR